MDQESKRQPSQVSKHASEGGHLSFPGKDLIFLKSGPDVLRFREEIWSTTLPVPLHRHLRQKERFTVLKGRLAITLGKEVVSLREGETIEVPRGVLHTYAPVLNEYPGGPVVIEVEIWPPLDSQRFFETIYGWTLEGRLPPTGPRDIVAFFALCHSHRVVFDGPPVAFVQVMNAASSALAGLLKIEAWSPRYSAQYSNQSLPAVNESENFGNI